MSTRNTKFLFWFVILALIMACVPSFATPFPTANPNQVNQFIAQTANAAATKTEAALPTSTPTATITPTPRTVTPTPTFTSTVIFILSSPTKPASATSENTSGSSSDKYACQILSVKPANGTSFKARDDFNTFWKVKNIGKKEWDRTSVDFVYSSGAKIHKVAGYDLANNVSSGETITLGVDMVAPKNSGTYTTTWVLSVGNNDFCTMSLTIAVK